MARSDPFVETLATVPAVLGVLQEGAAAGGEVGRARAPCRRARWSVSEGAAGTEFFVIIDGRARVERHGKEVASLGPGGFFGDLALLDRRRATRASSPTPSWSSSCSASASSTRLLDDPGFSKKLLAGLARRLRAERDLRESTSDAA